MAAGSYRLTAFLAADSLEDLNGSFLGLSCSPLQNTSFASSLSSLTWLTSPGSCLSLQLHFNFPFLPFSANELLLCWALFPLSFYLNYSYSFSQVSA